MDIFVALVAFYTTTELLEISMNITHGIVHWTHVKHITLKLQSVGHCTFQFYALISTV